MLMYFQTERFTCGLTSLSQVAPLGLRGLLAGIQLSSRVGLSTLHRMDTGGSLSEVNNKVILHMEDPDIPPPPSALPSLPTWAAATPQAEESREPTGAYLPAPVHRRSQNFPAPGSQVSGIPPAAPPAAAAPDEFRFPFPRRCAPGAARALPSCRRARDGGGTAAAAGPGARPGRYGPAGAARSGGRRGGPGDGSASGRGRVRVGGTAGSAAICCAAPRGRGVRDWKERECAGE